MNIDKNSLKDENNKFNNTPQCVFCHGTGVVKCFDFTKNKNIPNGFCDINILIDKYGEYAECPEGCTILN